MVDDAFNSHIKNTRDHSWDDTDYVVKIGTWN